MVEVKPNKQKKVSSLFVLAELSIPSSSPSQFILCGKLIICFLVERQIENVDRNPFCENYTQRHPLGQIIPTPTTLTYVDYLNLFIYLKEFNPG